MALVTPRLDLIPFNPAHLLALMEGTGRFETLFGYRPADGLRGFFASADVSPEWAARLHAAEAADPWVFGFGVVHRATAQVIGAASFKGAPDPEGVVEIAYAIVPSCEGQGYATEAASALLGFAFADERVRCVRAHTAPAANASTSILRRCGFTHVGPVEDPDDGTVWRWSRTRE